jgi:hypothetical protein
MTRIKTIAVAVCTVVAALLVGGYLLFHGYFDTGKYEIRTVQWSASKQVAVVAKRSDNQALNGDEYFVLIGDHLFSEAELRHGLHSDGPVFSADRDCLTLRWNDPHDLVITCDDKFMTPADISVQHHRSGQVAISYVNIPNI